MRTIKLLLAAVLLTIGLAACSKDPAVTTFCNDVRTAESAPYSQATFETLQRDFPYVSGDDGYTAGNAAANAYSEDIARPGEPSVTFLTAASVYLEGWCGGA